MEIEYRTATTQREFKHGKDLFRQYAVSLNIDLSFQDFAGELAAISRQYSRPKGALHLAYSGGRPVGCAGIRAFDTQTAELKRMFVLPECRGQKMGRRLLELCIASARELHYKRMVLDTLPHLAVALHLYRLAGFEEIPSYRYNPFDEAVFMEKKLE